ncbi:SusC/RagA family TonB-linked outer membrane protein [Flammeovirga yaeyamensis]|uniref:SusC/RagA family TonB-linked outer membrane protein n=1 Tax=Flammeovirga yaeyamensis TaxID=367791 RepID=UPI0016216835|nr:TonB-dependent receptor [Flammeovirga yaeyamensis]
MKNLFLRIRYFSFSFCLLMYMNTAFAQTGEKKVITGTITSEEDGMGFPGASIVIEGTSNGVVSRMDGGYTIEATSNDVLVVSFIGFQTQKIPVGTRSVIDIALPIEVESLEEVVVVGYGAVRKSDVSGSVASVKSEDLAAFPVSSAVEGLQGRAPGVQIQSANGGQPGSGFNIKVRGGTSINASSNPLIVVDGFVGAEMPPAEDIASMEILKDASSTAIYGSRGANGVILISTKTGESGKVKVDINTSYTTQQASNRLDLLDGQQFASYINDIQAYEYGGANTNWQDEVYQNGGISNTQVSISGGSENVKYYVSGTYFDQKGIINNSGFKRYSVNSNVNAKLNNWIKAGVSVYTRRGTTNGVRTQENTGGSGSAGVIGSMVRFNPDLGIYDENGVYTISTVGDDIDNPVAMMNEYQRERVVDRLQSNSYFDFAFTNWLSFKTTLGLGVTNSREGEYWPTTLLKGDNAKGLAGIDNSKASTFLTENYFTIKKETDNHRLNWVNGYSYQKDSRETMTASAQNMISNSSSWWALQQGGITNPSSSALTEASLMSFYSRANYTLKNRYVFTVTARYDGASNFAENHKWAFFPSAAVAWDINNESFMQDLDKFSEFKLRASYGISGNQAIDPYQSLARLDATYSIDPGQNALKIGNFASPDLTWETTSQVDVGLDVGIFNGRLTLSADYYDKNTSDLLFFRQLPTVAGLKGQLQNVGEVNNSGFEIMLRTNNFVGDFEWDTEFVFSRNRNEVLSLPDSTEFYGNSPEHMLLGDDTQLLVEGQPVGVFYGYRYLGVYQEGDDFVPGSGFETEAGGERFADLNGDGELTAEDREIIGDPNPDFTWSLNNSFRYKNFDLNIFIQGVHGQDMISYTHMELETLSGKGNSTTNALNRWTPNNTNTDVPKANGSRPYRMSDRFIYDASFIRLKNIALGYNFPKTLTSKMKVRSLRVYASAQNLLTFTDYPGLDPEVGYGSGSNTNRNLGADYASYPNVKGYTFGINVGL